MSSEEFADCPRCGTTVELFDGRLATHDAGWHIGAPSCPASRQTPADVRDEVAVERALRLIRQCHFPPPSALARCEMHPAAWEATARSRATADMFGAYGSLGNVIFGVPIDVRDDLPAGCWRALDRDGNVLGEGMLT